MKGCDVSNGHMTASYIPDGYTQSVYFREEPGIYGETRCTYRPLTITEQGNVQRELSQHPSDADWDKRQWIAARWLVQKIVSWTIAKPTGEPVNHREVSEVMRLRPPLFNRLWNCLNSLDGGDPDPEQDEYERHKQSVAAQAVAMGNDAPQVAMEKN